MASTTLTSPLTESREVSKIVLVLFSKIALVLALELAAPLPPLVSPGAEIEVEADDDADEGNKVGGASVRADVVDSAVQWVG